MHKQFRNGLRVCTGALLVAILLLLAGVVPLNLTLLKDPISRLLENSSGLDMVVSGELHLRLGLHPRLSVTGLEVMSAERSGYFLRLGGLALQVQLGKLLNGELAFDQLSVSGLSIDSCAPLPHRSQDQGNELPALSLSSFDGEDIEIFCSGSMGYQPVRIDSLSGTAVKSEAVSLAANVQWQGRDFRLDLEGDSLDALLFGEQPYAVAVSAETGGSRLAMDALIEDFFKIPRLRAEVSARLVQPDNLLALFAIQATGLPEISLQGHLGLADRQLFSEALSGHFGESSWSLSGSLDWGKQRPKLILDAQWNQLDIDALGLPGQSRSPSGSVAPQGLDQELPLQLLDLVDATVDLRVSGVTALQAAPADLVLHLDLNSGQPRLEVTDLRSPLGSGSGRITLDRGPGCPAWDLTTQLAGLDLAAISELAGLETATLGTLAKAEATGRACGKTLQAIKDSLELEAEIQGLQVQPPAGLSIAGVESATLSAGWRQPAVIEARLVLDDQPVDGRIEAAEMALLERGSDWPAKLSLVSAGASLAVKGLVRDDAGQASAVADLTFAASRSGPLMSLVGFKPGQPGKFALDLHADIAGGRVEISDFKLALGRSNLAGSLLLQPAGSELESDLVLRSRFVDLVELEQILAAWEDPASPGDGQPGDDFMNLAWPSLSLDLAVADIHGFERDISDLRLTGSLRDSRIDKARLALAVSGFSLLGKLDADFGAPVPHASIEARMRGVDLGSILANLNLNLNLGKDTEVHAEQVWLRLTSSGNNWQKLAHNLELDFELLELDSVLVGDQPVAIRELAGTARPRHPVSLSFAGTLGDYPVNGWMQLAPIRQLLDPLAPLPVRAVLGTDRETVMLDGTFRPTGGIGLDASLQLSAMKRVVARADMEELSRPLPGLVVDGEFDLGREGVQTIELAVALGDSRLEGSMVASDDGARTRLQIGLNSPYLQTTDFSQLVALIEKNRSPARPVAADGAEEPVFLELLDDYLKRLPASYDMDIEVSVDELFAGEHFLGSAKLISSIRRQNIDLGVLELSWPDGEVNLNYRVERTLAGAFSQLDARVENFELGGLLRTLDPKNSAEGVVYLDSSLRAEVSGKQEVTGALAGHFNLAVFPRDMNAEVLDLWATNLIFALMPKVGDDQKEVNCVVARFDIEEGIMHSKSILLDSTDVVVRGKGKINLAAGELDLLFAPQAKRERFFSVSSPIYISGPIEDFNMGMAGAGWIGTVFRWYLSLIYVPWKWLTGERFSADGIETCLGEMNWRVVGVESTDSGATH